MPIAEVGDTEAVPTSCVAGGTASGFETAGTLSAPKVLDTRVEAGGYQWLCIRAELDANAGLDSAGVPAEKVFWTFDATSDDA